MPIAIPWFYTPLLIGTALLQILLRYPVNPPVPIFGLTERCNRTEVCAPANRTNYDATFLCCEDETYWPASHILAPMWITVNFGNPWFSAFLVGAWEHIEAVTLTLTRTYGVFPSDPNKLETAAGAMVGDALVNGILGVLLGSLILSYTGYPGILPFLWREGAIQHWSTKTVTVGVMWKYFAVLVLTCAPFLFGGNATSAGVLFGPYITLGVLVVALLLCSFWIIRSTDVPGYDMRLLFRRVALIGFIVTIIISFGAIEINFLANNYFQVWLLYYVATLVVFLAAVLFPTPLAQPATVHKRVA
jgi:hypothetical protein